MKVGLKKALKVIIIAAVILLLLLVISKCLKKDVVETVEGAEISGIVAVNSQKLEGDDATNITNNLVRLEVSQTVDDKADALIKADLVSEAC